MKKCATFIFLALLVSTPALVRAFPNPTFVPEDHNSVYSVLVPSPSSTPFHQQLPSHHTDTGWTLQFLDPGAVLTGMSIAMDLEGNSHICYANFEYGIGHGNPEELMYFSSDGENWSFQPVTPFAQVVGVGAEGLAMDQNNNPHVVFTYFNGLVYGNGLLYASYSGGNWSIQTVDANGTAGALALDSAGNPCVAYIGNDGAVKYATLIGSNWDIQTVDSGEGASSLSMALDSSDYPHLIYSFDSPNKTVKYATWNGSSWIIQTVLSKVSAGNIALDKQGFPHFTYDLASAGSLVYASWNGTTWNTQIVDDSLFGTYSVGFLKLDFNDAPHISYYTMFGSDNFDRVLKYATFVNGTWDIQAVDSVTHVKGGCPLALDSGGNGHICYLSDLAMYQGTLMYATFTGPVATPAPLPSPTVPELPSWIVLPLMFTFAVLILATVTLRSKTQH